jgi:sulfite reductase beta subunit-like hemoprotein
LTTIAPAQTPKWTPDPKGQRVLPILADEIENFENEVRKFRAGQVDNTAFTRFRLRQGIYGQRQPDRQMVRVKIPFGGLTYGQMIVLGRVADRFAPLKKGHLTTRENVQYHHVDLDHVPELLRMIGDVGLTTREACGNTVRNVVANPTSGVLKGEVFDVTPYAGAYARWFLRHPTTQDMPRKVKTAFSSAPWDPTITKIHDVGFIAKIKDGNRGFEVRLGGGTSIMPRLADTLYDFVPVEDFITVAEAALRIFNRSDEERKNRMKARIKYTINRVGIDEFRSQVEEELKGDWAKNRPDLSTLMWVEDEEELAPPRPVHATPWPKGDAAFDQWVKENTEEQKQPGFRTVYALIDRGDIFAEQWGPLAEIARDFAGGRVRIDQQQNMVFRWVREESLYDVYLRLREAGFAEAGRETIRDIVTCPGTDSCKLGITSSMGLNAALGEVLDTMDLTDPLIRGLHIKASGCPNGCGQHHIANIGFHGAVMKGQGGQVPAYELFLGGNYEADNGPTRFGLRIKARVPARRAPEAVKALIEYYRSNRQPGERFNAFVDRVGATPFEALFGEFAEVGPLNRENIQKYMDWGKTVLYRMERGEGECAV